MKKIYMISLMVSGVATAIAANAMSIMLSYVVQEYSLAQSQEGLMSSCISAGALAALVGGVFLRRRIPKKDFIMIGGLLMTLMLVLKSTSVSFPVFLGLCLLMGIGMGSIDCFQSALLSDLDPSNTAKNLGMFHAIFGMGGILLPLIIKGLLSRFPWRMVYLMIGVMAGLLVLQFILFTSVNRKNPVLKKVEPSQGFQQMGKFLGSPVFVLLLACMFVGAAAQNGVLVWTVRYVSNTLKNPQLAPFCLSAYWVCNMVSRIMAPRLPVRPIRTVAVGSVISGAAWCTAVTIRTPAAVMIACILIGFTSGCVIPLLLNEGAVFNRENTGLTTSALMFVKTSGQMLTPLFVAFMQVRIGISAAMFLVGLLFILDALLAFWTAGKQKSSG